MSISTTKKKITTISIYYQLEALLKQNFEFYSEETERLDRAKTL